MLPDKIGLSINIPVICTIKGDLSTITTKHSDSKRANCALLNKFWQPVFATEGGRIYEFDTLLAMIHKSG